MPNPTQCLGSRSWHDSGADFYFTFKAIIMKAFVLTFLLITSYLKADSQTITTAVAYNDFIVNEQNKIGDKTLTLTGKLNEEGMTKELVLVALEDLLSTTSASILAVQQLAPFEDGADLKQSSLDLFQFYARIFDSNYREMVNLLFLENLDDEAITMLNSIVVKIQTEEAVYDEHFRNAQNAFAEKHNIQLGDNEIQERIDKQ
jgi:hypothetical protein